MQKIIANPDILIGKDLDLSESYKTATLDGGKWQNPAVVKKIFDSIPTLPHFCNLFIAFFKGAAQTWEHFTSEFSPGGLIDEATAEERELAHMPAATDENEVLLGFFQHLMHYQPQLTLLSCNALIMFFCNNTEAFIEFKLVYSSPMIAGQGLSYTHTITVDASADARLRAAAHTPAGIFFCGPHLDSTILFLDSWLAEE